MLKVFSLLNQEQRTRYISQHAVYLLSIEHDQGLHRLFSCDDFFVEFQYSMSDPDTFFIVVFDDLFFLDPYLVDISLSDLFR